MQIDTALQWTDDYDSALCVHIAFCCLVGPWTSLSSRCTFTDASHFWEYQVARQTLWLNSVDTPSFNLTGEYTDCLSYHRSWVNNRPSLMVAIPSWLADKKRDKAWVRERQNPLLEYWQDTAQCRWSGMFLHNTGWTNDTMCRASWGLAQSIVFVSCSGGSKWRKLWCLSPIVGCNALSTDEIYS